MPNNYGGNRYSRYGKRRSRRVRRRRVKPNTWNMSNAVYTAGKALSLAKYLKGLVNVETMYSDSTSTNSAFPTSWTVVSTNLLNLAQGDTSSTRTGGQVRLKSMHLKMKIHPDASAPDTPCVIKVAIVINQKDSALNNSDIFADTGSLLSFRDRDYATEYKILKIFTISYDPGAKQENHYIEHYARFNKVLEYADTTSVAPTNFAYSPFVICDEATDPPLFDYNLRMGYIDN